jgi:hypothetical protein
MAISIEKRMINHGMGYPYGAMVLGFAKNRFPKWWISHWIKYVI